MKYLNSLFLLLALIVVSCGSSNETDSEELTEDQETTLENNFSVSGTVEGAQNVKFYVEAQSQNGVIRVADAKADEKGKFQIEGNIPEMGMYQLRMGENPQQVLLITLVPGDELIVKATADDFSVSPSATGTRWSGTMTRYMVKISEFRKEQEELAAKQASISAEEMESEYKRIKGKMDAFAMEEMTNDPGNPFNIVLSTYAVPATSFADWDAEFLTVLNNVSLAFNKEYSESAISTMMAQQVYQIEVGYNQFIAMNSGERVAPEIILNNPEGQPMALSSLRGKYVLVDFWASWCAPCRRENPNVIRLYNKYKDKGFTIYSVSLDQNATHWKAAIEKDGLLWPNHVSDLKGWNTPLTKEYGFSSIPHTVLVDKDGYIIGTGLRGAQLEQKLEEIFSN